MSRRRVAASLIDEHYDAVYRFARRLVDHHTAEDAAQEVFLRVLSLADLDGRTITSSYLIKATHNLIREWFRRKKPTADLATLEFALPSPGHAHPPAGPGAPANPADDLDELLGAFDQLTRNEDATLRLIIDHGRTLRQAASALGVPVTSVTNWKYRALKKLVPAA